MYKLQEWICYNQYYKCNYSYISTKIQIYPSKNFKLQTCFFFQYSLFPRTLMLFSDAYHSWWFRIHHFRRQLRQRWYLTPLRWAYVGGLSMKQICATHTYKNYYIIIIRGHHGVQSSQLLSGNTLLIKNVIF